MKTEQAAARFAQELLAIELWKQEWGYYERNRGTELMWLHVAEPIKVEFRVKAIRLINTGD